jgi:glycosyltransferase involved in cell wall biosynthesis
MRILVLTQYFPPDMGAPAGRFFDFAQHWIAQGHEVTVVTGLPHFPGGEVHAGYRWKPLLRERVAGIDVRRCFTLSTPRRGGRPLAYVTFLLSASLYVLLARLRCDVVVATSPPPTVGLPGLLAARWLRVPFVLDIRDIWPEAIVQSGRLRNPLLIRLFEGTARLLYRAAARIATVTDGWRDRLVEIGVPPAKVQVLPNGVDVAAFDEQAAGELADAFAGLDPAAHWFTYAGILNKPQGLEVILEAAARLRERAPDLYAKSRFVLVGEGPCEAELRALAARLRLDRVSFFPRQPRAAVFALLRRSFAILVTLRPRKDTSTVPSKLYESLASARPVLYSAGGEGAETVRRAGGGMVCEPGDADALCDAMRALLEAPDEAARLGAQGRDFVTARFDRRGIAADFTAMLEAARRPALPAQGSGAAAR